MLLHTWNAPVCTAGAGDLFLLDTTKELIHSSLLTPTAGKAATNGTSLDQDADDAFGSEVSAAMVEWIAKRMSDYHKNFHDTQLMQVWLPALRCSVSIVSPLSHEYC